MSTHPFLTAAETRAAHLREIDRNMTALGMREVRLADVQREIPEIEAAMAVYRRLNEGGVQANPTTRPVTARKAVPARVSTPKPSPSKPSRTRRAADPPSFKEFALTQLDTLAQETDEATAPPPPPQAALA